MTKLKVIWTNVSKQQLKEIYLYYKELSVQAANNIKNDILKAGRELIFSEQFQKDEVEPNFRRIIVRHYKLVYTIDNDVIYILRIFDTRRNPEKQKNDDKE